MSDLSLGGIPRGVIGILPATAKTKLRATLERLQSASLRLALREQGLWELQERLKQIVPDLKHQYSSFEVDSYYLQLKVRGQHAFQIALATEAIKTIGESKRSLELVDVGDSAGTHIKYLQELNKDLELRCLSINADESSVKRIQAKGLQALHMRAEEFASHGINADIFLSFEMLEHLPNPIQFLKSLSYRTACQALVITVPYVAQSRVALHHIRGGRREHHKSENIHIFEFCPSDWRALFIHSGWSVYKERLYLQYPRYSPLRTMKPLWKTLDYEGFWGAILQRDHTWSDSCGAGIE